MPDTMLIYMYYIYYLYYIILLYYFKLPHQIRV